MRGFSLEAAMKSCHRRAISGSNMTDMWFRNYQRALILLIVLLSVAFGLSGRAAAASRSPLGDWLTANGGAVVRIGVCHASPTMPTDADTLCGRIIGIKLDPGTTMPRDYLGRSQCGFRLIRQAHPTGTPGVWHGHIVDPRNGHVFSASLRVTAEGQLALHGYLLLPVLGETQRWTRYTAPVPRSCRIVAG